MDGRFLNIESLSGSFMLTYHSFPPSAVGYIFSMPKSSSSSLPPPPPPPEGGPVTVTYIEFHAWLPALSVALGTSLRSPAAAVRLMLHEDQSPSATGVASI